MNEFIRIPLADIIYQNPLRDRNEDEIEESSDFLELIASISQEGLLQPICVVRDSKEKKYRLLFGKRRFLAFSRLFEIEGDKFSCIPTIVLSDEGDNKHPIEVKILHENKYRQNIRKDSYLESALCILPVMVNSQDVLSLEKGIELMSKYSEVVLDKNKNKMQNRGILEFIKTVGEFLGITKIKLVELAKYNKVSSFEVDVRNFFYNNVIFFSDTNRLNDLHKNNTDDFNKCIKQISAANKREDNSAVISSFIDTLQESNLENTLSYLKNRFRSIKRNAKDIDSLNSDDAHKIKELVIEMEVIFKNAKENND